MNGVVVIDKPQGPTSRAVVEEVKRALGVRKAGHTGTLDPLATGVLPVCVGEATKLVQFLALDDKEYRATLLLGVRTDTLDIEGSVLSREDPRVAREQVEEALLGLTGRREQTPPRYSAVKFRGKALHDWTRRGIAVEALPREVEIYDVRVEEVRLPEATFTVSCSKGTYIRSLCAEVGEKLGCGGCMSALRRTRSGCFREEQALAMEGLTAQGKKDLLTAHLLPMTEVLPGMAVIGVDQALAGKLRNGYQPDGEILRSYHIPFLAAGDVVKLISHDEHLVAVGRMLCASDELAAGEGKKQAVRILRVFND
ncbi:MAG: tRNA pseudouridine(55) synthase TruB [Proteobacteria bacterium]|nr:tRNA pseudouridine(55) synthase TruB [Pseudomonadota bacterium]MBU2226611.1 tRNA pseudouridine(55) synthase TruB [Pseudomonadota bacterium]